MHRRLALALLPLAGCAASPDRTTRVTLPEGLARRGKPAHAYESSEPTRPLPASVAPHPKTSTPVASSSPKRAAPAVIARPVIEATATGPVLPERPAADETARLGYRLPGGAAIEVAGVCRFDESSVACWDGEGAKAENVRRLVETSLNDPRASNSLSIRFGRKNRILVVREETPTVYAGKGDRRNLSLMEVGPSNPYGGGGYLNFNEPWVQPKPGEPQVRHEARVFAADPDARDTTMRISMSEPMPQRPELRLTPGASATLNGVTVRVLGTSRLPDAGSGSMFDSGPQWKIRVAVSGRPTRPGGFYPTLPTWTNVDKVGRPVDRKVYDEWQRRRMETWQTSGHPSGSEPSPYRPAQVNMRTTRRGTVDETEILTNVDPKLLGKIVLDGRYTRLVEVTGIPLDPH